MSLIHQQTVTATPGKRGFRQVSYIGANGTGTEAKALTANAADQPATLITLESRHLIPLLFIPIGNIVFIIDYDLFLDKTPLVIDQIRKALES